MKMKIISLILIIFCLSFCSYAQVEVKPALYEFGGFPESRGKVRAPFELVNHSEDTVRIINLKPSCGCAVALVDTTLILPKEKVDLTVIFNAEQRPGEFRKTIKIHFKSSSKIWSTLLAIEGYVIPESGDESKTQPDSISVRPFRCDFVHQWDTTGYDSRSFKKFINGLTYIIDQDGLILIQPIVTFYQYYGEHQFLLNKIKKSIEHNLIKRGYKAREVAFQISKIRVRESEDYVHEGNIILKPVGYSDSLNRSYSVKWTKDTAVPEKDSIIHLETFLEMGNDTLAQLKPGNVQPFLADLSSEIITKDMMNELFDIQVALHAYDRSERIDKILDLWQSYLKDNLSDFFPKEFNLSYSKPSFVKQEEQGLPFKIQVNHIAKKMLKDTVRHVFNMSHSPTVRPSIPIMQLRSKNPGKGDFELYQKKRLFANFREQGKTKDTLELLCVVQHNGYLKGKNDRLIREAIDHYKLLFESIYKEAQRQGYFTKTNFWVQPFHPTYWTKKDSSYISLQVIPHFSSEQGKPISENEAVYFYKDAEQDSLIIAGAQLFYLDKLAKIIRDHGHAVVQITSYLYSSETSSAGGIKEQLIEQTRQTIKQIRSALLKKGVDPSKLLVKKEKIAVRDEPLTNLSGFGSQKPENSSNKSFIKVVLKKGFF